MTKDTTTPKAYLPLDSDKIYNLKINADAQKFTFDDKELDYGKFDNMNFRVLALYNKIVKYNSKFEVENETKLFQFAGDADDAQGGKACGRLLGKQIPSDWTKEQKEQNKNSAKWYTLIFGIMTPISNTNRKGETIPVDKAPVLCDFRISGGTQKEANDLISKIKSEKGEYHKAEVNFKLFENTEFDWPKVQVMADFNRELPVSGLAPFMDTIKTYVETHNTFITNKAAKWEKYGGKPYIPKADAKVTKKIPF